MYYTTSKGTHMDDPDVFRHKNPRDEFNVLTVFATKDGGLVIRVAEDRNPEARDDDAFVGESIQIDFVTAQRLRYYLATLFPD